MTSRATKQRVCRSRRPAEHRHSRAIESGSSSPATAPTAPIVAIVMNGPTRTRSSRRPAVPPLRDGIRVAAGRIRGFDAREQLLQPHAIGRRSCFVGATSISRSPTSDLLSAESRAPRARFRPSASAGVTVRGAPAADDGQPSRVKSPSLPQIAHCESELSSGGRCRSSSLASVRIEPSLTPAYTREADTGSWSAARCLAFGAARASPSEGAKGH